MSVTQNETKSSLRIGTFFTVPYAYPSKKNSSIWEGFCLDTIGQIAEEMNCNYEVITDMDVGRKLNNGTWTGLIGLLATARLDMIVGPLVPTPEMEEVVDFVPPFYTSVGFSIVVLRPIKDSSLFKFLTALNVEVWASLVLCILITALLIWIIEHLSPSSSTNIKSDKQLSHRKKFSFKESLWFAATSLTQQGGGETPQPLAAKTLVTAYWVFAVLMLAAFMANLAALQTVERLPYPIQSFDELMEQTRIKYTVIRESKAHKHLVAMQKAEARIYKLWKDVIIKKKEGEEEFVEWTYPVKERYKRTLVHIRSTGIQPDAETAYAKVLKGEIVLVHDDFDIRFRAARDCRLKEIGETFSPRPYYVALQHGSPIANNITLILVDLLRHKYFEYLTKKYTEPSDMDRECLRDYVPPGITTSSLGGVFICTLIGVGIGIIALILEITWKRAASSNTDYDSKHHSQKQWCKGKNSEEFTEEVKVTGTSLKEAYSNFHKEPISLQPWTH